MRQVAELKIFNYKQYNFETFGIYLLLCEI
jgi:hypothetical protein